MGLFNFGGVSKNEFKNCWKLTNYCIELLYTIELH